MQYEPKPHVQNKKRHIDVVVPVPANKRLRASMVKPKTLGLYSYAVEEFEAWCGSKLQTRVDHDKLDKLLTAFILELLRGCQADHGCLLHNLWLDPS